jgi:hypothetical protein
MPLPPPNVTAPTAPPSFSATPQINGTILFEWTRPVVKPLGTEFQIIRSTNSANAAVGTVIWQGAASPVPLVSPTSPHWYFVRSIANSVVSPYMPNTFGVEAVAVPEANYYDGGEPISDPDFKHSTRRYDFWAWDSTAITASLSLTGGLTHGRLRMDVTTTVLSTIISVPKEPIARLVGARVQSMIRARVSSIVTSAQAFEPISVRAVGWTGTVNSPAAYLYSGRVSDSNAQCATLVISSMQSNVGRWFEASAANSIQTLFNSGSGFLDPTSYPYLMGGILVQVNSFRGVLEFDLVKLHYA